MPTRFMFLFLTFFLIVTCCTFESDGPIKSKGQNNPNVPLATISKIVAQAPLPVTVPVIKEEAPSEYMTEVEFTKGKLTVPEKAKEQIKLLFEKARKVGKIRAAKIITWADQALPRANKKSLSWDQLKLAEDRNDKIEAFLEKLDLRMNVSKISMAEKPEVMEDLLSREDKKLRKTYEEKSTPFLSKSIVMFLLKGVRK